MDNVIEFDNFKQKRPELVWQCIECDNQTFYILVDSTVECTKCSWKSRNPALQETEE